MPRCLVYPGQLKQLHWGRGFDYNLAYPSRSLYWLYFSSPQMLLVTINISNVRIQTPGLVLSPSVLAEFS